MRFVSDNCNALILFADVVDSSVYSSVWGITEYAKQLLKFQELFVDLGKKYFPNLGKDKAVTHYSILSRGDEGVIFCVDPDIGAPDLVYNAVKFSYELKARMELFDLKEEDSIPKKMKIAIGIHYGSVASITSTIQEEGRNRSIIDGIEGFAINYAKRIESSSRVGRYSKIFLSKESSLLLEGDPIVFVRHMTSLKGIENNDEVYEIRSAYFEDIPLDYNSSETESFINYYSNIDTVEVVREPWLKGLIISVLDSCARKTTDKALKIQYLKTLSDFAWKKPMETDPILLFWRGKESLNKKELTKSLDYFKKIVNEYPDFMHTRTKMVEVCWELADKSKECSELIYARDTATEFLEKYPTLLNKAEKDKFEEIVKKINKKRRT